MYLKIIYIIFCLSLTLFISSCNNDNMPNETTVNTSAIENVKVIASEKYCYALLESGEIYKEDKKRFNALDWSNVIEVIEGEFYEAYDKIHSVPTSATLHKDGQRVAISLNDERLIKLLNFYHNSVYNNAHAYTQGRYNQEYYEELISSSFRLELTFVPIDDRNQLELCFDKVIVSNYHFICINSDMSTIEGMSNAIGQFPYFVTEVNWLEVFGF